MRGPRTPLLRGVGGAARRAIEERSLRGRRDWGTRVTLVVLAAMGCGVALAHVDESEGPPPALGRTVPDFSLLDPEGCPLRLSDVHEPVVVLNVFAFWCCTWVEQLPQLRELVTREDDLDFRLISISIDGRWASQLGVVCGDARPPFPILLDGHRSLVAALGIRHAPTVLVLDEDRVVRYAWEGYPGNHRVLRGIRRAASEVAEER